MIGIRAHAGLLLGGSGVVTPTMLDPLNKGTGVTLTNSNKTATKTTGGVGWKTARSVLGVTTGKYYLEALFVEFSGSFIGIALGSSAASVENYFGFSTNGIIYVNNGTIFTNNALSTTIQTIAEGQTAGFAFDVDARLFWVRNGAGNWNNSGTANPATGVGGLAFPAGMTGTIYFGACVQTSPNDQLTINFGPTFTGTPPAGFGILGESSPPSILGLGGVTEGA